MLRGYQTAGRSRSVAWEGCGQLTPSRRTFRIRKRHQERSTGWHFVEYIKFLQNRVSTSNKLDRNTVAADQETNKIHIHRYIDQQLDIQARDI